MIPARAPAPSSAGAVVAAPVSEQHRATGSCFPRWTNRGSTPIIDGSFTGFGNIEWAVPAFALGVPGLLLMVAVGLQAIVGVAWLPFIRRWLGGVGVRRRQQST